MNADEFTHAIMVSVMQSGNRRTLPALPADQLDAIFSTPSAIPPSPDGWAIADDPELDTILQGQS